jgi:hypothetical protein
MDDLQKLHIRIGWALTGAGAALIVVNAMNTASLLCLGLGIALLAYAKTERA